MKTASEIIGDVFGDYTIVNVKGVFGIDTAEYSWVDDFLKDKKNRDDLEALKNQSRMLRNMPIDREELRNQFVSQVNNYNEIMMQQTVEYLKGVQARSEHLPFSRLPGKVVLGMEYYPYCLEFTEKQLDKIFSQLPEGTKSADIEKSLENDRHEIAALEEAIAWNKFPRSRWWFRENGLPHAYPMGCQWTTFVKAWAGVLVRFSGNVDINGYPLTTEAEFKAFVKLGLDKLGKQDCILKNPRQYRNTM